MGCDSWIEGAVEEPRPATAPGEIPPTGTMTDLLEIQRNLAIKLLRCKDLPECLEVLLAAAMRLPGVDCGGTYLCDETTGGLRLISHHGLSDDFLREARHHPADSPQNRLVRAGSLVYGLGSELPPSISECLALEGLEMLAVLPLKAYGKVVGSLNASSHDDSRIHPETRVVLESMIALAEGTLELIKERSARLNAEQAEAEISHYAAELSAINTALSKSEEKYRNLHESMMDAYAKVEMDGRIIESNIIYQQMLGYTPDELSRMSYVQFTPESWHAMEARLVEEQIIKRGFSDIYEKEYIRRDGTLIPVELRTFLIRDEDGTPSAMWAIIRDISQRRKTEQTIRTWNQDLERLVGERTTELRRSEDRYRQLAEATFEGIGFSENGIVTDGNPQMSRMLGYEAHELIGRPVMDFIAPESQSQVSELMRTDYQGAYEIRLLCKNGSIVPVDARASIRHADGRKIRVVAFRDLTQSKQVAAQIKAQQAELDQAQRMALISEIAAGIIHQIGQPLSAIATNIATTIARLEACELRRCNSLEIANDIKADVTRMRDIVVHFRSLANPEKPARSLLDFNELVAEVLPLLQREADHHQVRIDLDLHPQLPPVKADAVQMKQVMFNLVYNAFEACAACPPMRRVVRISTRSHDSQIELTVRDAGTGMAPEVIERLFSPFFTTKQEGQGIGLRLSRTLISAHQGSINGHNNPDGFGASFMVRLPCDPSKVYTKV